MKMCKSIFFLTLILLFANFMKAQNVGVGTATPGNRLDVQGATTSTTPVINATSNNTSNVDVRAIQGNAANLLGFGYGGHFTGGYQGVHGEGFGGTASIAYGVYGFATGSSGTRYGVYGLASGGTINYGVYGAVSGAGSYYGVYGSNPNSAGYAGYFSGRGFFSNDLNVNDVLGVGFSTTPSTRLQILNGSDCSLTTNGFAQFGATTGWNLILDDNEIMARNNGAGNDMFIQNDAGNILMCGNEAGKVGIGITAGANLATGYIFSVDGKIIAEEVRIQNSDAWPDYVFEEQYPLMPLAELKTSIELHNHLPNIPSATEVETDGILVGDMQIRMIEKIEELTLYVIELHQQQIKLQEQIDTLKSNKQAQGRSAQTQRVSH